MVDAGSLGVIWGWFITGTFTMIVAMSLAEICSAFPTTGGKDMSLFDCSASLVSHFNDKVYISGRPGLHRVGICHWPAGLQAGSTGSACAVSISAIYTRIMKWLTKLSSWNSRYHICRPWLSPVHCRCHQCVAPRRRHICVYAVWYLRRYPPHPRCHELSSCQLEWHHEPICL